MLKVSCLIVFLSFAALGCGYQEGSFRASGVSFPGQRATSGCLDVASSVRVDLATVGPAIEFNFGNRCDRGVIIDFARVRVRAFVDGQTLALIPQDPRAEIIPAHLDGRWSGREVIAYSTSTRRPVRYQTVCVDVSQLDRDRPGVETWSCTSVAGAFTGGS